ncbi:serine protease [Ruficoccus sp. ZRK36]|uniref:S1 family peptidase n=1 Tax=Ruficoccus sp. ZRK36 TaxID=2866311 RepID=UPI001C7383C4|nr:serine protease [Ruficoccus sp. ZRK36]QYY34450.1 serine protease [Ruficoccus sp. ZRK36]
MNAPLRALFLAGIIAFCSGQLWSQTDRPSNDNPWLQPSNPTSPPVDDPEPGTMEWLQIHYPQVYADALIAKVEWQARQDGPAAAHASASGFDKAQYQQALVLLEGDNGTGTAFICKVQGIPFLLTNIHMLACAGAGDSYGGGLQKLDARTLDGRKLTLQSIYGAREHDLCILRFAEEADYEQVALEFEPQVATNVKPGDFIVIPGNSKGGGTMIWTEGRVVGIGPTKVEHDAPVYEGNSGSPIIHIDSGKIIGVLSYAEQVPIENYFDKESFNNEQSAIKSKIRYYGYRIDSANDWYPIDLPRFCRQNDELESFRTQRQNVAIFLYADSDEWRDDAQLMEFIDQANEQARRKSISDRIGRDSLREIYATLFRQLDGIIHDDTYRAYVKHMRLSNAIGGPQLTTYYPYFDEMIEREVKIRDYLSKNIQEAEKRVRK